MTPLRIAFDMDGTLADLASAYCHMEDHVFGPAVAEHEQPAPEEREERQHAVEAAAASTTNSDNSPSRQRRSRRSSSRHRDQVWQAIEATPDFWTTLKPIDKKAIKRLYHLMGQYNWEVFFITQRPATAGGTVQWQTQKWLIDHGFPTPSVIPLSRGRGKAASVLHLDFLVDDTPQNCVDVLADSTARSILLLGEDDPVAERSARRLGIATARDINQALDLLVQASEARANPSMFEKLRKLVGWK